VSDISFSDSVARMDRDATEHGFAFTRSGLENSLNTDDADDVTEEVTIESLAREIAFDEQEPDQRAEEDTGVIEEEEGDLSAQKTLECLALARSILERHGGLCDVGRNAFSSCQRALRLEKNAAMRQTTILDHFKKIQSCSQLRPAYCIPPPTA